MHRAFHAEQRVVGAGGRSRRGRQVPHLPIEPVELLDAAGRDQELARTRAFLDPRDGDGGARNPPARDAAFGDVGIARDRVVRRHGDAAEDLSQQHQVADTRVPGVSVDGRAEIHHRRGAADSQLIRLASQQPCDRGVSGRQKAQQRIARARSIRRAQREVLRYIGRRFRCLLRDGSGRHDRHHRQEHGQRFQAECTCAHA